MKFHSADDLLAKASDETLPLILRAQAAIGLALGIVPRIVLAGGGA